MRLYRYWSKKLDGSWTPGTAIGVVGKTTFSGGCWWVCDSAEHNEPGSFGPEGGQFKLRRIAGPTAQTFDLEQLIEETEAFLVSVDGAAVKEVGRVSEQMQRIHDKIAECDREAELRGWDTSGFPRLWFAAVSRVAGLDLQERRRKARHPANGSIPLPVTRDTSPGIFELQQQNDELRSEITQLREERRWVPVGERLPEDNVAVLCCGDGVGAEMVWREQGKWRLSYAGTHVPDVTYTHWMPLPDNEEGGA